MLFTVSLTDNRSFLRLYKKGTAVFSRDCTLYFMQNRLPFNRLGITTGKKIGNAVVRNRVKRIIKAAYQQNETRFPVGFDIVIVAKPSAKEVKSTEISKFLGSKVITKMNCFEPQKAVNYKKR